MDTFRIDGKSLTLEQVSRVSRRQSRAELAPAARARMSASRAVLEKLIAGGTAMYGVNTGFGKLKDVRIPPEQMTLLQENLIHSHCSGVGASLPAETVRAILLLRANTLAQGPSAIRPEVVDTLLDMLAADLMPEIPSQGSVCASGDLAPLAHLALAAMGEGSVRYRGELMPAAAAFRQAKLAPIRFGPKEGLSVINGTQVATAIGCLAAARAGNVLACADIAAAMSIETLRGSSAAFDERLHLMRPHRGQIDTAANLRRLLADSGIMDSHRDCDRLQDSYALRCVPQVHGAVRDTLRHLRSILKTEINSVTDNPILDSEREQILLGGNFHGAPIGYAMDFLAIAFTDLASISERRMERLLNPSLSGLPPFLAGDPGLQSGFMMAHVTAAGLVSENKGLSHPASVDSIPTSAAQEDHVSMGTWAARKAAAIVENTERVVAIEILAAAQGLDLLHPLAPARALAVGHRFLRGQIPPLDGDRVLAGDIETAAAIIRNFELRSRVETVAGPILE